MRILSTPFFPKFFGGKIKSFEQRFALENVSKKQHKNSILFLNLWSSNFLNFRDGL